MSQFTTIRSVATRTAIASLTCVFLLISAAVTTIAHAAQSQQLLFAYFNGANADGLFLAIRDDQGVWQRLNGGRSVFNAAVGDWKIFRDPHLSREHDGRWRIVWTTGGNNYGFVDSTDLVSFTQARAIPTNNVIPGEFKYTWAPEINWDEATASYLITWSANLNSSPFIPQGDADQRIYAHNTKDFINFTPTRKFYDPGYTIIDTHLIQQGGQWRLFFKDERPGYKAIRMVSSTSLDGPWSAPSGLITPSSTEGSSVIPENGGYSLYFDYFTRGGVYGVMTSSNLTTWSAAQDVPTGFPVRHGSFVWLSQAEADQLRASYGGAPAQSPFNGTPMAVPGTIATAQYDNGGEGVAYHDTDTVNQQSSTYRVGSGVDSPGSGVGWIYAGEWLEYTVNVGSSGAYTLTIPVCHQGVGGTMHVSFNGVNVTGALSVPNTGSWATFQNITKSVSLNAGRQVMQIVFDTADSAGYGPGLGDIVIAGGGGGGGQTPFNGSPMAVPGTIPSAQYDNGGEGIAYHDTDTVNQQSSTYRLGSGVDSTGSGVGWVYASEWLEYTVNVSAAGSYTLTIPVCHQGVGGTMHVSFNGVNVTGSIAIPNTGSWATFQNITRSVTLNAGVQIMQVVFDTADSAGYGPGLGNITISAGGGTGPAIPGTIAASNYDNGGEGVAFHDSDMVNQMSNIFRPGLGVDANAGQGIGWIYAGEWMNYTVNVANAGNYVLSLGVCNPGSGGTLHVEFNGVNKTGAMTVPNTGSWSATQTINAPVNLSAGQQVMKIRFDTNATSGFTCGLADSIVFTPTGSG